MNLWLKYLTFSFLLNLSRDSSKNKSPNVLSSPNWVIKVISNHCQDVIDLAMRLKNHIDALPTKVYGNNLQTTYSCSKFINLRESINCLIWYSTETSLSGINFVRSFSICLGKGCWAIGTTMELPTSQGQLDSILAMKLRLGPGYEILVQGGFVSGGSRGPKPPAWASRKS